MAIPSDLHKHLLITRLYSLHLGGTHLHTYSVEVFDTSISSKSHVYCYISLRLTQTGCSTVSWKDTRSRPCQRGQVDQVNKGNIVIKLIY